MSVSDIMDHLCAPDTLFFTESSDSSGQRGQRPGPSTLCRSGRGHPPSGTWEMWMAPNAARQLTTGRMQTMLLTCLRLYPDTG